MPASIGKSAYPDNDGGQSNQFSFIFVWNYQQKYFHIILYIGIKDFDCSLGLAIFPPIPLFFQETPLPLTHPLFLHPDHIEWTWLQKMRH